jgi:hypothetical protein
MERRATAAVCVAVLMIHVGCARKQSGEAEPTARGDDEPRPAVATAQNAASRPDGGHAAVSKVTVATLARTAPRLPAPPPPVAAPAVVVEHQGHTYFMATVPAALLAETPSMPTGVPCGVRSGDAYRVFFVAPNETTGRERYRPYVHMPFTREENGKLKPLRDERIRLHGNLREIENRRRSYGELLKDEALPQETRDHVKIALDKLQPRFAEMRKRSSELDAKIREIERARDARQRQQDAEGTPTRNAPAAEATAATIVGRARRKELVEAVLPASVSRIPLQAVRLDLAAASPASQADGKTILDAWGGACLASLENSGDDADYLAFARRLLREDDSTRNRRDRLGRRRGRVAHPFDLFTGAAAIRESLQLEAGFASLITAKGTIPVEQVRAIDLKDHPFDTMRAGRAYAGSTLADLCPPDAVYVRVRTLKDWFRSEELFNRWGGSILSTIRVSGKDRDSFAKYRWQLGLRDETMARLLGSAAIGEFALFATDPLFEEGTGVALAFTPLPGQ